MCICYVIDIELVYSLLSGCVKNVLLVCSVLPIISVRIKMPRAKPIAVPCSSLAGIGGGGNFASHLGQQNVQSRACYAHTFLKCALQWC